MKCVAIDADDDAVFDAQRNHSNCEGGGYCCPHCLRDNEHGPVGSEREAVACDHCGKTFVVWDETEIRQCSGPLAA